MEMLFEVLHNNSGLMNSMYVFQIHGEDTGDFFDTYAAAYITETETNRTVYISVCDDDLPEADETFTFYLTLQVGINFSQKEGLWLSSVAHVLPTESL